MCSPRANECLAPRHAATIRRQTGTRTRDGGTAGRHSRDRGGELPRSARLCGVDGGPGRGSREGGAAERRCLPRRDNGTFEEIATASGDHYQVLAAPFTIRGADVRPRGPVPAVGEHTNEVLEAYGFGAEEIADLASRRVFG